MIEPDPHRARDHRVDPAQRPGQRSVARLELGECCGGRQLLREPLGVHAGLCRERFDPRQGVGLIEDVLRRAHAPAA